jgi:type III secretion protein J
VFSLLLILLIFGCNRASIYSNLNEKEAVEMQAILLNQGIDCDKIGNKDNLWELKISKSQLAEAVELLKGHGYPKNDYANMGTMFKKEGLVSSPLEQRIRYIYALSQEVAHTISNIDGVITARVHIVLPENDPLSEYFQPSSASVFIKHRSTFDIQSHVHQVKQLVVNSVEGLSYDKVTVVPFASSVVLTAPKKYVRAFGILIVSDYLPRLRFLVFGPIIFQVNLMIICMYLLWRNSQLKRYNKNELMLRDNNPEMVK